MKRWKLLKLKIKSKMESSFEILKENWPMALKHDLRQGAVHLSFASEIVESDLWFFKSELA